MYYDGWEEVKLIQKEDVTMGMQKLKNLIYQGEKAEKGFSEYYQW